MLLQAVVYPYIIATLITSLGELKTNKSIKLFMKSWYFYLFLLIIAFGAIAILGYAIPSMNSKLGNQAVNTSQPHYITLIIPENLFSALTNNFLPAVIIFCLLFGITLQKIKNKKPLIEILKTISETSIEYWRWLVKLAPIATFAMLADDLKFKNANTIRAINNLRIAVHDSPILINIIQKNFPKAKIVILDISSKQTALKFAENKIDAVLWSNIQTQTWVLGHPGYVSINPSEYHHHF